MVRVKNKFTQIEPTQTSCLEMAEDKDVCFEIGKLFQQLYQALYNLKPLAYVLPMKIIQKQNGFIRMHQ